MKKSFLIISALLFSFGLGFAVNSLLNKPSEEKKGRVTGIGGIFFKCKDPKAIKEWYSAHLGMKTDQYGTNFEWFTGADSTKKGYTQWSAFKETTKYFLPSTKEFMINYRVDDLTAMYKRFKAEGVTITDSIETVDYGKFLHIMDPEGNKIELWEPIDIVYEKGVEGKTK
jgi:predicted enzyme related to lactoylglutathione lyase